MKAYIVMADIVMVVQNVCHPNERRELLIGHVPQLGSICWLFKQAAEPTTHNRHGTAAWFDAEQQRRSEGLDCQQQRNEKRHAHLKYERCDTMGHMPEAMKP